ncbi:MAG: laccase domain-containing protein, partial [Planctomycetota bacterium]
TVDVREAARLQLERAGVHQVDVSDGCTWNDSTLFHSHRRDVTHGARRRAGSLGALIAVRP